MSVLCTVIWNIRPERSNEFVSTLGEMFVVTSTHEGFIRIHLFESDDSENHFILVQEWESTAHHQAYAKFRSDRGDTAKLAAMTAGPTLIHYWTNDALASA
jgi:quinol monooxygenase YgiN